MPVFLNNNAYFMNSMLCGLEEKKIWLLSEWLGIRESCIFFTLMYRCQRNLDSAFSFSIKNCEPYFCDSKLAYFQFSVLFLGKQIIFSSYNVSFFSNSAILSKYFHKQLFQISGEKASHRFIKKKKKLVWLYLSAQSSKLFFLKELTFVLLTEL